MSVIIGDFEIDEKYGAFVYPYIGGILVRVSILGAQPIMKNIDSLKEGEVYEMESKEGNGLGKLKKLTKAEKKIGQKIIYQYDIDFEAVS